jgi:PhoD related phosphatase
MVWLENILTSKAMTPLKALGRAGILKSGFLNRFDGGVEVLDDLDDHWTASGHKEERNLLIQDLQDLAAEKSVRITILGGDVHLGAVGQFYSNPKLRIQKDRDHRYIPNVISSAIVNTPPPEMLADTLNKRNKVHLFDPYTVEDMIPMFTHDVDGKKRNNKRLLPRRNWCSIREYHPGSTPPPTPPESSTPSDQMSQSEDYPPQTRRRFSFSREDANPRKLIRRLSQRGPPSSYRDDMIISSPIGGRRASHDGYFPNPQQPQTAPPTRTSFPMNNNDNPMQPQTAPPNRTSFNSTASYNQLASIDALPSAPQPRPGIFRRPTNLSEKAAKKGGAPPFSTDSHGNLVGDLNDHINLEGGLDITLNCEVNQGDPAGITTPYRLLIPALRYDGSSDSQKLDASTGNGAGAGSMRRKPTLLGKLGFGRTGNRSMADRQGEGNWGQASDSGSESLGGEAQYNGQHDDLYYEGEKRPLSGGGAGAGLKRWFSDRRGRKQQDERYSPDYEPQQQPQQSSLQQRARQLQTRTQTQLQDEFVGRELRTTPPQPPLQQHNQKTTTTTPASTKRTSATCYDDNPLPIEPFPSQARGKAARVMGVDQGPPLPVVPPYSRVNPQSQPQRQPPQPQAVAANANLTRITSVNHSQPLARATTLPLPSPQDRDDGSARFYAGYELGRPEAQGQGQRGGSARVAGVGAGAGQGPGEMVRGYSGVEAYREKRRGSAGGKLRKWF